nr:MAG TPA: 30S ribosomal protein S11 [Caudoviricetes sp.]DAM55842.1 MAG TPA: 30S ribosomal protein S11 [Caudoviricetes sp.]
MSDYISREAAIEDFEYCTRKNSTWTPQRVKTLLMRIPAADVEPVRYGRWEPGNQICPVCGEDKFKDLDADIWSDWTPPRCPNCGAKMFMGG